jgi:hypothetical protein
MIVLMMMIMMMMKNIDALASNDPWAKNIHISNPCKYGNHGVKVFIGKIASIYVVACPTLLLPDPRVCSMKDTTPRAG